MPSVDLLPRHRCLSRLTSVLRPASWRRLLEQDSSTLTQARFASRFISDGRPVRSRTSPLPYRSLIGAAHPHAAVRASAVVASATIVQRLPPGGADLVGALGVRFDHPAVPQLPLGGPGIGHRAVPGHRPRRHDRETVRAHRSRPSPGLLFGLTRFASESRVTRPPGLALAGLPADPARRRVRASGGTLVSLATRDRNREIDRR
jgi:hypothetical protein